MTTRLAMILTTVLVQHLHVLLCWNECKHKRLSILMLTSIFPDFSCNFIILSPSLLLLSYIISFFLLFIFLSSILAFSISPIGTYPPCSDGEFRLVPQFSIAGNESSFEFLTGGLQICSNGVFLPVCNTTDYEPFLPQAVCTSLGYSGQFNLTCFSFSYISNCVPCLSFFTADIAIAQDSSIVFTIQNDAVNSITCNNSPLFSCTVGTTISPESCPSFVSLICLRSEENTCKTHIQDQSEPNWSDAFSLCILQNDINWFACNCHVSRFLHFC